MASSSVNVTKISQLPGEEIIEGALEDYQSENDTEDVTPICKNIINNSKILLNFATSQNDDPVTIAVPLGFLLDAVIDPANMYIQADNGTMIEAEESNS